MSGGGVQEVPTHVQKVHQLLLQGGKITAAGDLESAEWMIDSTKDFSHTLSQLLNKATPWTRHYYYNPEIMLNTLSNDARSVYSKEFLTSTITDMRTKAQELRTLLEDFSTTDLKDDLLELSAAGREVADAEVLAAFDDFKTKASSALTGLSTSFNTEFSTALTDTFDSVKTKIIEVAESYDADSAASTLNTIASEALSLVEAKVDNLVTKVANITTDFSSQINNRVSAFEDATLAEHQRATARLVSSSGQQGSNFSTGLSMALSSLESERLKMISDYRQKVISDLQDKVLAVYTQTDSYLTQGNQALIAQISNRVSPVISMFGSYLQSLVGMVTSLAQGMHQGVANSNARASGTERVMTAPYASIKAEKEKATDVAQLNAFASLVNNKQRSYELELNYRDLLMRASSYVIQAQDNYYNTKAEIYLQDVLWNMDVWMKAGNFLGAPGASIAPTFVPDKKSQTMSAVATGAAIGAAVGGPAAPYTAVAGALAGLAGAVSG